MGRIGLLDNATHRSKTELRPAVIMESKLWQGHEREPELKYE